LGLKNLSKGNKGIIEIELERNSIKEKVVSTQKKYSIFDLGKNPISTGIIYKFSFQFR
jgi:hypothetical protein